jgi:hypothetical protein
MGLNEINGEKSEHLQRIAEHFIEERLMLFNFAVLRELKTSQLPDSDALFKWHGSYASALNISPSCPHHRWTTKQMGMLNLPLLRLQTILGLCRELFSCFTDLDRASPAPNLGMAAPFSRSHTTSPWPAVHSTITTMS